AHICRRDSNAFEALSLRYRESIYRHILALIHDAHAAEDLVQEVFLRIWTHAEQWHGSGTLHAWLFRIATNLALNHLRTVQRRRLQALEIPADPLDEDDESSVPAWLVDHAQPGPDVVLEQSERHRLFQQLVNGLPIEKREVLHLVHDAEMNTRQVAEMLGIPEGTVKSRLHYATQRLAREWHHLAQEWEDLT
ncbi:MAG: RNA polymerase sigma factor, partial [Ktedonobacteraceae bacterium]